MYMYAWSLSCVWLSAALWTVAHQALLPMEFSRQEYWSGLPFPSPGNLLNTGIEPVSLKSSALAGRFFTSKVTWEALIYYGLPWWLGWWRICLQCRTPKFDPWVGKIPWRREWLPTPVFLPGESYGQRSLAGYSSRVCKDSIMTEWLILSIYIIDFTS